MARRGRIIDTVILPHKGAGFLLPDTKLDAQTVDGVLRVWEHRQVWLVVPVERHGSE